MNSFIICQQNCLPSPGQVSFGQDILSSRENT